ncbi:hypothetical protein ABZ455_39565, partial [Streptomyces avermitilis]
MQHAAPVRGRAIDAASSTSAPARHPVDHSAAGDTNPSSRNSNSNSNGNGNGNGNNGRTVRLTGAEGKRRGPGR